MSIVVTHTLWHVFLHSRWVGRTTSTSIFAESLFPKCLRFLSKFGHFCHSRSGTLQNSYSIASICLIFAQDLMEWPLYRAMPSTDDGELKSEPFTPFAFLILTEEVLEPTPFVPEKWINIFPIILVSRKQSFFLSKSSQNANKRKLLRNDNLMPRNRETFSVIYPPEMLYLWQNVLWVLLTSCR